MNNSLQKRVRRPTRQLTEEEEDRLSEFRQHIHYSSRYSDDHCEYRHVILPKRMLDAIPKEYFASPDKKLLRILEEDEWRGLGITQSLGWEHYEVHAPEPHILLFKRPKDYNPRQM